MAKGITFLMIVAGLTILFNFAGIQTGMGLLMERLGVDILNNPENFGLMNLLGTAIELTAFTLVGVAIGATLGYRDPVTFLIAGYASLLITFVIDLIVLISYIGNTFPESSWASGILTLILLPIGIGYIHEMVSWWSNR